mgnify:CR=1 FL=1
MIVIRKSKSISQVQKITVMKKTRRYDIDWIRVLVFDILILFHVGMFFNTWDWHIKNDNLVNWLQYPMAFTSQWRIPILFVVSGMGTRFALSYRSGNQYIKERFERLFIPLVVGMLIIVAPQVYFERVADGDFTGSFFAFYPHYFDGIYPVGNFSWHHLWFLPYLFVFSILATPLFLALRKDSNAFMSWFSNCLSYSPWGLYVFVIPLILIELTLGNSFPITRSFWGDWYALLYYFVLFISGFLMIRSGEPFWKSVLQLRWPAFSVGTVTFCLIIWGMADENYLPTVGDIVKTINMWSWIVAIFGFSAQYLNKKSTILKYRNEAVYPFYIVHQTIIITSGFYLMDVPLPIFPKFAIMTVATFGGSWLFFEVVKRVRILRPLFGLKT